MGCTANDGNKAMTPRAAFEVWIRRTKGIDPKMLCHADLQFAAWQAAQAETAAECERIARNSYRSLMAVHIADNIRARYPEAFAAGGEEGK